MQFEPKVAAQHATLMGYWCFVSLLLTVLTRPCPRGSSQNLGGAGSPLRFSTVTPVPALVTCRPREDFNLSGCVHNYVLVLFPALIQDLQHLVKLRRKEVERSDDGAVWSKLILLHDFLVVHSVLRNVREGGGFVTKRSARQQRSDHQSISVRNPYSNNAGKKAMEGESEENKGRKKKAFQRQSSTIWGEHFIEILPLSFPVYFLRQRTRVVRPHHIRRRGHQHHGRCLALSAGRSGTTLGRVKNRSRGKSSLKSNWQNSS